MRLAVGKVPLNTAMHPKIVLLYGHEEQVSVLHFDAGTMRL